MLIKLYENDTSTEYYCNLEGNLRVGPCISWLDIVFFMSNDPLYDNDGGLKRYKRMNKVTFIMLIAKEACIFPKNVMSTTGDEDSLQVLGLAL